MKQIKNIRLAALIRFSIAITALNILGFAYLGFEQSYAHPIISLLTAYILELFFEYLESRIQKRKARFLGSLKQWVYFLLPAHITALAVAMLLYTNEQYFIQIFATAFAILSKYIFRIRLNGRVRHFFNPSNMGIAITLILFPWVGISQPYMFTENFHGIGDWMFPLFLVILGTLLNAKYTRKLPLILSWLCVFVLQAGIRALFFDSSFVSALLPITGLAFLLFTFYMVSDPGTTPTSFIGQIVFGASVALIYGLLMISHIVFGLFFSLLIVCFIRGLAIYMQPYFKKNLGSVLKPYKLIFKHE
ncbi:RnfABCDGE type electron transport complex subunit D [Changchengzhania lutea]|uniref:RnfABCDGE type electron transport complex subunit D n=1 Tax=Changchengzhania lutea TaxID=2049305 RepID=UPI00115D044B|nr:RnfABCDGE type electron transport complex subunit D [Changchengzhania lutea]